MKLVNPANKRKYTRHRRRLRPRRRRRRGATLAELGYNVKCFCFQDSPAPRALHRRAGRHQRRQELPERRRQRLPPVLRHGQGRRLPLARGQRLPPRRRSASNIIDQCVAQGVPFAREYGGLLANRSFGGAQVSRTFYARGQTGQQLLLGAYQALERQIGAGHGEDVSRAPRCSTWSSSTASARGIVTRDLVTGKIESHAADAVVLGTGGYGNVFYLSTNAKGSTPPRSGARTSAARRSPTPATRRSTRPASRSAGEYQSKLTLMSESLRNDGRVWVPQEEGRQRARRTRSPKPSATTTSSASTRASATSSPRDIASRAAKEVCDEGRGVGPERPRRVPRLRATPSSGSARATIRERYGNLFEMYERITGENPYKVPMRIYPAVHYTMGGLWVDYNLMSTIPGLFVIGEANFSDHGANRLGASALMQGLADGYFVLPVHDRRLPRVDQARARSTPTHPAFSEAETRRRQRVTTSCSSIKGKRTRRLASTASSARSCGSTAAWRATTTGLRAGARARSRSCARSSGATSTCSGSGEELNQSLEKAGRVADFLELGELMCLRRAASARSRAAATSARSTRRPTARRCATTSTSPTSPPGSTRATDKPPVLHKEPLDVRERAPRAAELQVMMNLTLHVWRQKNASDAGRSWSRYEATNVSRAHVVPRDARRRQRGADREGRGADRLRPRLPRRHLRHRAAS